MKIGTYLSLISCIWVTIQAEIRGPPRAEKSVVQVIGHVGETLKIPCPINGYPPPMIEWSKGGETIDDYSWDRYRVLKKLLRIRRANDTEDTAVFVCKGINGFGSEVVRVEVIVIDPEQFPSLKDVDGSIDVAPPIFTEKTQALSDSWFHKDANEVFEVDCEALGSPVPRISWYKNGHLLENFGGGKKGRGSQSIKYRISSEDAGNYTCRASNLIGEVEFSFRLDVVRPKVIVNHPKTELTGKGPSNTTVKEGQMATMTCRVKSDSTPHIKWLKKLNPELLDQSLLDNYDDDEDTLSVGNERYRILKSDNNVLIGDREYLNQLRIPEAQLSDTGMYICFVTNSGFMPLTYKSAFLEVLPKAISHSEESMPILISVICLSAFVFLTLVIITICVVRNRQGTRKTTGDVSTSDRESHRPFIAPSHQQNHHHLPHHHNNYNHSRITPGCSQSLNKLEPSALPSLPPPPPPPLNGAWSHTIYPAAYHQKFPTQTGSSSHDTSISSSHYENPSSKLLLDSGGKSIDGRDANTNQYEVPFSHLMNPRTYTSNNYPTTGKNFQYFHYLGNYYS